MGVSNVTIAKVWRKWGLQPWRTENVTVLHRPGIITRQAIRRGTFTAVKDLVDAIGNFIDGWNERRQPFVWTKTADQILSHAKPLKEAFTRH